MKLVIFGATGATGKELVTQGLQRGHEITAYVRNPEKLTISDPGLQVVAGSVDDLESVSAAMKGHDGALSALGHAKSVKGLRSPDIISRSMRVIVPAMERQGVNRLIFLSALGVGESHKDLALPLRMMTRLLLGKVYADKQSAEELLRRSHLEWTLVYPTTLTNGPGTGEYRAGEHLELKLMSRISRADVAEFMLSRLDDTTYSRKVAVISR
jgi:putative NADH-flavin reductase